MFCVARFIWILKFIFLKKISILISFGLVCLKFELSMSSFLPFFEHFHSRSGDYEGEFIIQFSILKLLKCCFSSVG